MKRTLKMLLLGVVAAGLMTGCPKGEEAKTDEPKQEEPKQEEPKQEEPKEEEPKEEEPEKVEVDEAMYIKAGYEVTCVRAKVEDTETQKGILTEVYARYGFTEESFAAAEKQLAETPSVQEAIKTKMEACTPEAAAGFKEAGAEDKPAEEEKKEEKTEKKKPAFKGGKFAGTVTGGGVTEGKIDVTIKDDMTGYAKFSGKREGKKFNIPMKGSVGKDGKFTFTGGRGANKGTATGVVKSGTANGRIKGSIHQKAFSVTFNAK